MTKDIRQQTPGPFEGANLWILQQTAAFWWLLVRSKAGKDRRLEASMGWILRCHPRLGWFITPHENFKMLALWKKVANLRRSFPLWRKSIVRGHVGFKECGRKHYQLKLVIWLWSLLSRDATPKGCVDYSRHSPLFQGKFVGERSAPFHTDDLQSETNSWQLKINGWFRGDFLFGNQMETRWFLY